MNDITIVLQKCLENAWNAIPLILLGLLLMYFAKLIRDFATKYDDNYQLFEDDNNAVGIATFGYYAGILISSSSALIGPSNGTGKDMLDLAIYGTLAIILLNIARFIANYFILNKFEIDEEIVKNKNKGIAWVMVGVYVSTGLIVRGAIIGESTSLSLGIGISCYYFILGQLVLILITQIYQSIKEFFAHKDNTAAGLAFGGFISGIGVILGNSNLNHFNAADTVGFFLYAIIGTLILLGTRFFLVECILIPGKNKINKEIFTDHNQNAGWMIVIGYQIMAWIFVLAI